MTPAQAQEIDRLEFEAECKAIRQRAYELQARGAAQITITPGEAPKPSINGATRGRKPKTYTFDGITKTIRQWSDHLGISDVTLTKRLRSGWPLDRVFTAERFKGRRAPCAVGGNKLDLSSKGAPNLTRPGVVDNFARFQGTGAGSTAQETFEITFSAKANSDE